MNTNLIILHNNLEFNRNA